MNRRELLKIAGISAGISILPRSLYAASAPASAVFIYCLNMATIRGHKLGFIKELEVAAKAGFRSVEIWMDSLQTYLQNGGTVKDAKKRLNDLDIKVENAIGFTKWIVPDEAERKKGIEQMKREMELLAQIDCRRTAALPMGATEEPLLDLQQVAERYRTILELGDQTGVVPQLELWGFSKNLHKLSEVTYVAIESGHPSARILLDVFHLYKGGSSLATLPLVNPHAVEILHVNDYAANIPAATIADDDRIYPGDGIAPIRTILQTLKNPQRPLIISTEVFNRNYYRQDALTVAATALAKMKKITTTID